MCEKLRKRNENELKQKLKQTKMETTNTENKQKWNQTKIGQKVETRSQKKGGKSK